MVFYLKVQSMNYLYDNEFLSYWVYFKKINYLSMCMKLRVCFFYLQKKVNLNVTSYDSCVLQVIMMRAKKLMTCVWYISKPIKLCDMSLRSTYIRLFIDIPMSEYICTLHITPGLWTKNQKRKLKKNPKDSLLLIIIWKLIIKWHLFTKKIRFIETLFLLENECSIKKTLISIFVVAVNILQLQFWSPNYVLYSIH